MVSAKQARTLQGDYGQVWSPECLGMVSFLQKTQRKFLPLPQVPLGRLLRDAAAAKAPCSIQANLQGL